MIQTPFHAYYIAMKLNMLQELTESKENEEND